MGEGGLREEHLPFTLRSETDLDRPRRPLFKNNPPILQETLSSEPPRVHDRPEDLHHKPGVEILVNGHLFSRARQRVKERAINL